MQAVRADEGLLCGRDGRRRFAEHPHAEQIVQKKEVQRDESRGGALRAAQGGKGSLFHGGNRVEGEGAGVEPRGDERGRGNLEGFRFGTARGGVGRFPFLGRPGSRGAADCEAQAHGGGNAAVLCFGAARRPCEGSSVGAARGAGALGGGLALRGVAVLRGGVRFRRHG